MTDPTEVRTISSTGGEKGVKDARFDLIPPHPLWAVATHYGVGARKYEARNWERGYEWSKSFGALQRHAVAWWAGEDIDDETGSNHLAAIVFHAFALLEFTDTHPEFDDRPTTMNREVDADLDPTEDTDYAVQWLATAGNETELLARARAIRDAVIQTGETELSSEQLAAQRRRQDQLQRIQAGAGEFFNADEYTLGINRPVDWPETLSPDAIQEQVDAAFGRAVQDQTFVKAFVPEAAPKLDKVDYSGIKITREQLNHNGPTGLPHWWDQERPTEPIKITTLDEDPPPEEYARRWMADYEETVAIDRQKLREAVQRGLDRDQR